MLRNLTLCAGALVAALLFSSDSGACCGMRCFSCYGCASYGAYDTGFGYGGYGYGGYSPGAYPYSGYGYGGYPAFAGYGYSRLRLQ
jgi:hypothetical protein